MGNLASVVGTVVVGTVSGALTGAASAVAQSVQAGGPTQDWRQVAGVAAVGAAVGVAGYWLKSPRS